MRGTQPLRWCVRQEIAKVPSDTDQHVDLEDVEGNAWPRWDVRSDPDRTGEALLVRPGDVLYGRLRPYLRKTFVADRPLTASTEFLVLRPDRRYEPRFIGYVLRDPLFADFVSAAVFGAKMPRVSWEQARAFPVHSLPLDDQRAAVSFLDEECRRISAAIDAAVALPRAIGRLIGSLTDDASSDHQQRLKTGLAAALAYGASESSTEGEVGWPRFIRITDIDEFGDLRDEVRRLPPDLASDYMLVDGDVLLARSGATVGKAFRYREVDHGPCCFAGYLIRARCDRSRLLPDYLQLITRSARWWDQISLALTQATIPNVSAARYAEMLIPVPPITEQHERVHRGLPLIAQHRAARNHEHRIVSALQTYRDSLVHEVVTGRFDLSKASDRRMDEQIHAASEGRLDEVAV